MSARRYTLPQQAIHNLSRLDELSAERDICLCISERTKHILNNLVILDIPNPNRYAIQFFREAYQPVTEGDPEYELFQSVAENAATELAEENMACGMRFLSADALDEGFGVVNPGNYNVGFGPVPEGEAWHFEFLNAGDDTTQPSRMYVRPVNGADCYVYDESPGPAAGTIEKIPVGMWLQEGQILRCRFQGVASGDTLTAIAWVSKWAV